MSTVSDSWGAERRNVVCHWVRQRGSKLAAGKEAQKKKKQGGSRMCFCTLRFAEANLDMPCTRSHRVGWRGPVQPRIEITKKLFTLEFCV